MAPTFFKDESLFKIGKYTLKKNKNIEINNDCKIIKQKNKYWL